VTRAKAAFAVAAATILFLVLVASVLPVLGPGAPAPLSPSWIGDALWLERTLDLAIQAFILLAGVFAIVLLLREEPGGARGG